MTHYIYVNWKKKDIVKTTSRPDYYDEFRPQGRKAKQLFKDGYEYFGSIAGFDLSGLHKDATIRKILPGRRV
jgi:hypothetical protein